MVDEASLKYFNWLVSQLIGSPFCVWLVFIIVLAPLVRKTNLFSWTNFQTCYFLIFVPFLVAPLMLVVGTLMRTEPHSSLFGCSGNSAIIFLEGLFYMQIAFSLGIIYYMKGYRVFAGILSLFQAGLSFYAWLLAGMSITGCWL